MWTKFDIVSGRIIESKGGERKYVVYNIKIHKHGPDNDGQAIFLERRYTDFLELYNNLRQGYPTLTSRISFPRKVFLGNFSSGLIQTRLIQLKNFLNSVSENSVLLDSIGFKTFLIGQDEILAKKFLHAKKFCKAKPLLEKNFKILNKIYTERHPAVILTLCHLVACSAADPSSLEDARKYGELALKRFDGISDIDLLCYYVPLLQMCSNLWKILGKDRETLELKLHSLKRLGHKVDGCPSLLELLLTTK